MGAVRLVSWNIAKREQPLRVLEESDYDVALIQEFPFPEESWGRELYDRGAKVLKLSDRVGFHELRTIPPGRKHGPDELTVSAPGIIAAAYITPKQIEPFIAVSLYARWEYPHPRTKTSWSVGYQDAMTHRAISDLSTFIGSTDPARHRIVFAGDFNLIHGATDNNPLALPARDRSVFFRLEALGLEFIGPQFPNGRQAVPRPPAAGRHEKRSDVPFPQADPRDRREPARLRVCLKGIPQAGGCEGPQRTREMGAKRSLPDRDRDC